MRIQNNIMAINTHRQYNIAINGVSGAAEKLSSGYRINRAGDDPAGLAISEKMRAQIRGLTMASKNSQDAVSLVQTAEGALQETHNILQRMRELAVQSASDTNETSVDRGALEQEFSQIRDEINDIASKTRFNDQNLIDGTYQKWTSSLKMGEGGTTAISTITVARAKAGNYGMSICAIPACDGVVGQGGMTVMATAFVPGTKFSGVLDNSGTVYIGGAGLVEAVSVSGLQTSKHNGNIYTLKVEGSDLANMSISLLDSHNKIVTRTNGVDCSGWVPGNEYGVNMQGVGNVKFGINPNMDMTVSGMQAVSGTLIKFGNNGEEPVNIPATPAYYDLTINGETVRLQQGDSVANFKESGIAFDFNALSDYMMSDPVCAFGAAELVTISVNQIQTAPMVIQTGANYNDELHINIDAMNANMLGLTYTSVATREKASLAIDEVNQAINTVSTQRAALGALQNRLDYKIANLDTSAENLTAAESRIRDVDMAKEMTNFTKLNIIQQAATSMLAQANQAPQNVLSLLQ